MPDPGNVRNMSQSSPRGFPSAALSLGVAFCSMCMAAEPPSTPAPSTAAIQSNNLFTVECGGFAVSLDNTGAFRTIQFQGRAFEPPERPAAFELNGETAEVSPVALADHPSFQLSSKASAGLLEISCRGAELNFHLTDAGKILPAGEAGQLSSEKPPVATKSSPLPTAPINQAGLVLTFPLDTVFHLAEYRNIGRQLDRDMPVGQTYVARLTYNFFVAQHEGVYMRFRLNQQRCSGAECHVSRQPDMFTVTFRYKPEHDVHLAVFSTMKEVLAEQSAWLEAEYGLKKLKDRPGVPAWVHDIKLIITADMLRSTWEIVHDFDDVLKLAREIETIRDPREILFYVPGLQGAYDAVHPTYRPHDRLGGEKKFRELMDYLNARGFKLMMHTTAYGINPYRPDIDELIKLVRHNEKGKPIGWQLDGTWLPANRVVKFTAEKLPLRDQGKAQNRSFTTPPAPEPCEALFTVGGVKAPEARIAFTLGHRTIWTPPGWFKDHDEYEFPYPLALQQGPNIIQLSSSGSGEVDFEPGWYRIRHAFTYKDSYTSWTWPILMGDLENPAFIELYTGNVSSVVGDYGIGVVHFDAASVETASKLTRRLREKLPDTAIAGEFFTSMEGLGAVAFCQGARQSLLRYEGRVTEQSSLPVDGLSGLEAPWQDKPSPVCRFVKEYCLMYPHLCAANAFVPVGKVCNIFPPRQIPAENDELMRVLKDAARLDYVPGLRVNYRQYGLDQATKRAIAQLR